jgi:hypothetical protein
MEKISEFDFKNMPMVANAGICPRCGYDGGGGELWKIIIVDINNTERGFWCDECDVFYPEGVGIYQHTAERPVPADVRSYLKVKGMDWFNARKFYEH